MADSTDPFERFSANLYLQEYYGSIGEENQFILDFLHETYESWKPVIVQDIGGGPTIYQLISASRVCREIEIFEYLEENRQAVQSWREQSSESFNWTEYFQAVALRENLATVDVENRLRQKIRSVQTIDLFDPSKLPHTPASDKLPNAISSHFCVESITSNETMFCRAWDNLTSLVRKDDYLIMSLLKNAHQYRAGSFHFPAFPVEEISLNARLKEKGFREITMQTVPAEHGRDYEGIICVRAIR